jgi:hypothetical protein
LNGPKVKSCPVPVTFITCGPPGALSTMEIAPAVTPAVVAVYATVIVQLAPAARLEPQVFVSVKVEGVTAILVIDNFVLFSFVTVTVSEPVEIPSGAPGKVTLLLERVT